MGISQGANLYFMAVIAYTLQSVFSDAFMVSGRLISILVSVIRFLFNCIPRRWHFKLARPLGKLSCLVSKRRSLAIRRNLRWCFPERSDQEREQLFQDNINQMGLSFFDTGVAWFWTDDAILKHIPHRFVGLDAFLDAQKNSNKGILLLGKHSLHMELDARLFGMQATAYGVARGSDSPLVNALMQYGRSHHSVKIGDKTNPRQFVRWLRDKHTVAYYPDQDYGTQRAVITTLFGVPATFTTAAYTLQKLSKGLVYFYHTYYDQGELVIDIEPLDLPMQDAESHTIQLAQYIEQKIAHQPSGYLWVHRRFKSTKGKVSYGVF